MRRLITGWLVAGGLAVIVAGIAAAGPRFYEDDPIAREPQSRSAAGARPLDISLFFEYRYNLFVTARRQPSNLRAGNINSVDEVPDSSWFTNRIGAEPIATERVAIGPTRTPDPRRESGSCSARRMPAPIPDSPPAMRTARTWFLQFDIPEFPEGGTGAVEVATKLFWALGYNQVQTFITSFDPARVEIDPKATVKRPSGARTPFTRDDLARVLERAARSADGTYRVSAGALIPGTILGAVPVLGHALRRPERSRAARAAPRAARAARLRGVDEPG